MRKFSFILPLIAGLILIFACAQCKKDTSCKARIIVYYSETGIDTGAVAAGVTVEIGKNSNFAEFAQAEGTTDNNGIFECEFPYEAVLPVVATITKPDGRMYTGSTQISLKPGETVEQPLLIMPRM